MFEKIFNLAVINLIMRIESSANIQKSGLFFEILYT